MHVYAWTVYFVFAFDILPDFNILGQGFWVVPGLHGIYLYFVHLVSNILSAHKHTPNFVYIVRNTFCGP